MLKKLLKYDLGIIAKRWRIFGPITLACAVFAAFAIRFYQYVLHLEDPSLHLLTFSSFAITFAVIAIIFLAVSLGLLLGFLQSHYRRSVFSDRGYLTLMIPVDRKTLFHAKLFSGYIYIAIELLLLTVSVFILFMFSSKGADSFINPKIFYVIGEFFANSWRRFGAAAILVWHELLFILFGFFLLEVNMLYGFTTLARKGGGGVWIGVQSALFGGSAYTAVLIAEGAVDLFTAQSVAVQNAIIILLLLAVAVVIALFNVLIYNATVNKLRYKLNLS